jgi:ABC-2 type transport system permease protein
LFLSQYRVMFKKNRISFFNGFRDFNRLKLLKSMIFLGFGGTIAVFLFIFFYRIFNYLKTVDIFGEMLTIRLITMVFLSFLSMLLFSNILTAISSFFISKDVEFLFSTPIRTEVVYTFKFIETFHHSSYMIMIFGVPVFAAYGMVYKADLLFYILALLVFIPFLMIPAAIGSGVTQVLMRFLPAKRTHQVLTVLGVTFLVVFILFMRLLEPEKLLNPIGAKLFMEYLDKMRIPSPSWLPSTIAAESIVSACKGDYSRFLSLFIVLLVLGLIFFFVSMIIANQLYRRGWADSKILKPRTNVRIESNYFKILRNLLKYFKPKTFAMIEKEIKFFFRDTSQWSQLFMLGALVILYIFNIRCLPIETMFLHNILAFLNICFAGFVLSGVAVRFAFPSISMEGRAFWMIQSSPVLVRDLVLIKFFIYLIPQVILVELIVLISNYLLDVSIFMYLFSGISVFFMTISLTGMGIGLGCLYPDFKADSPERVAVSAGGVIYMIASLAYIVLIIVFLASPMYSYFAGKLMFHAISNIYVHISYVLAFLVSTLVCYIPMKIGCKKLKGFDI